jgi:phage repressor protein C with HTH and peptisase S24 domain
MEMPVDPREAGPWTKARRGRHSAAALADRISKIARDRGLATVVSQQSLSNFEQGKVKRTPDWVSLIPDALTSLLRDEETSPEPGDNRDDTESALIREWDFAYGMGGGTYLDLPVTGIMHQFSRSWLRQFTHAPPDKIFLARGTGDSMTPTILDSDGVLIDTSERSIRIGDKIWALAYGEVGLIKRVRPMPDGSVKLLSDNQVVEPETAYDGELTVVGRVVAVVRKT